MYHCFELLFPWNLRPYTLKSWHMVREKQFSSHLPPLLTLLQMKVLGSEAALETSSTESPIFQKSIFWSEGRFTPLFDISRRLARSELKSENFVFGVLDYNLIKI